MAWSAYPTKLDFIALTADVGWETAQMPFDLHPHNAEHGPPIREPIWKGARATARSQRVLEEVWHVSRQIKAHVSR